MMAHIKEYHYAIYESMSDSLKIIQYYYHLKECHCADDWSLLTLQSQVDYKVGKIILHSGKKSLPVLKLLLYDIDAIIMCRGTEGNTLTYGYHLRIKDFAYRYAAIILGENPIFLRTREERDGLIDALIKKYPEYLRLD